MVANVENLRTSIFGPARLRHAGWLALLGLVGCSQSAVRKDSIHSQPTRTVEIVVPSEEEQAFRRSVEERPDDAVAQQRWIDFLLGSHRGYEALDAARSAVKWLPRDDGLRAALADSQAAVGDTESAATLLRALSAKSPRFRLKLAEVLLLGGKREAALRELEVLERQPSAGRVAVAQLYAAALEPERALSTLGRSNGGAPATADEMALLGTLNLTTGRYAPAAAAFQRALASRPGEPNLSFYRGVALRLGGKAEDRAEAVAALDAACRQMPDGRMFQFELALARRAAGDLSGALEASERAVEISANAAEVHRLRARLLSESGDEVGAALARATYQRKLANPEAAVRELEPWIVAKPHSTALASAAGAFSEVGDGAASRKLLERLPPIDTLPAHALWEAYRSYRAIAVNDQALACLEHLRKLTPEDLKVRDEQTDTLQTLGRYGESEVILRELQRSEPQNPYRPYQLALHLVLWSQAPDAKSEAERWFREAIRISPGFAGPRYRLGLLLLEQRQPEAAITQFKRALGISPRFADALRGLARAYDAAGKPDLARATYRHQRLVAQRDKQIERLKQPDKRQRISLENRRALVRIHLANNQPEEALSQLEVVSHLGSLTRSEGELLIRLYGLSRRYQRQHEERRSLASP